MAAKGLTNTEIAQRLVVRRPPVTKWRDRSAEDRLIGLVEDPRPGRPRTVTGEQVEEVIVTPLEIKAKERDALVDAVDS